MDVNSWIIEENEIEEIHDARWTALVAPKKPTAEFSKGGKGKSGMNWSGYPFFDGTCNSSKPTERKPSGKRTLA